MNTNVKEKVKEINDNIKNLEHNIDQFEILIDQIKSENNLTNFGFMFGTTQAHLQCFDLLKLIEQLEQQIDHLNKEKHSVIREEAEKINKAEHKKFKNNKYCIYLYNNNDLVEKSFVNVINLEQIKNIINDNINHISIKEYKEELQNNKVIESVKLLEIYELWCINNKLYIHKKEYNKAGLLTKHYINNQIYMYNHYNSTNKRIMYVLNGISRVVHIDINLHNVIEVIGNIWFYDNYLIGSSHKIEKYDLYSNKKFISIYNKLDKNIKELIDTILDDIK